MKADTRSFYTDAVQRAIERIVRHLDEPPDLAQLARAAGLSPFHFHRVFRGMTGETPLELTRRVRLERAASQLAQTDAAVIDIALAAGYESHEAFTRAFKASFSVAPTGFRERNYRRTGLAATCGIHYEPDGAVPAFVPRQSGGEAMQVDVIDMPALRLASVRHLGPYNQVNQAFGRLGAVAGPAGLFRPGAAMIGLYYDDPETTPPDQLRSDAGITVASDIAIPAGLDEQQLPAGRYAKYVHRGSYEQLGDVWARFLGEWLPGSGHRLGTGPSIELYRNTPEDAPRDQLITELYAPLAS